MMRMGWATPSYHADQQLGADENSYAFDGFLVCELIPLLLYPLPPIYHSPSLPLPISPLPLLALSLGAQVAPWFRELW